MNNRHVLSGVFIFNRVYLAADLVMPIGTVFFDIELRSGRYIGRKNRFAVFIAGDNLQPAVFGNHAAVRRFQRLGGIQPELHRQNLAVHADAEPFILLQHLGQIDLYLLPFIVESSGNGGDIHLLSRIGEFHNLRIRIQCHAEGRFFLHNFVPAKIQQSAGTGTPGTCFNPADQLALFSPDSAVKGNDVLICINFINSSRQAADRIHRLIDAV